MPVQNNLIADLVPTNQQSTAFLFEVVVVPTILSSILNLFFKICLIDSSESVTIYVNFISTTHFLNNMYYHFIILTLRSQFYII